MNELTKVFAYGELMVRVLGTEQDPRFVAADVCQALGIKQPSRAIEGFPEKEKGVSQIHTLGGLQEMLVVTEAGLYRLIFRSDKPSARQFQDWVFEEVLPEIRRTGRYGLGSDQLMEAYLKAKTGQVQLTILAAMGFGVVSRVGLATPTLAAADLDVGQLWRDVQAMVAVSPVAKKVFRAAKDGEGIRLFVLPEGLLDLARQANPSAYRGITIRDLREAMKSVPEWVPLARGHRMRLGSLGVQAVWCVLAQPTGNADLWSLAEWANGKEEEAGRKNGSNRIELKDS